MEDMSIRMKLFFVMLFIFGVFCIFYMNSPSQQISGVVDKVEYSIKGSSALFGQETKYTIVKFKDGRVKVFNDIVVRAIVSEGKFNIINFSREGEIVYVEVK